MVISVRFSLLSYSVTDSAQINSVRKSGLTIHRVCDAGYRKLSVLTGVPIEQVNFKENISTFGRDQRNQPLCTGVRINRP